MCRSVLFDFIAKMFQNFVVIHKNFCIKKPSTLLGICLIFTSLVKSKYSLIIIIYYVIAYINTILYFTYTKNKGKDISQVVVFNQ